MATHVSNLLIDRLPPSYRDHLYSRLEPISLPAGTTLYEPEVPPGYGHFMTSGMTSIVAFMADGAAAEVGVVGSEGVVEGFHVLGPKNAQTVHTRALVQVPGTALRMRLDDLREEFLKAEPLRSLVLGYVQSQAALLGQLSACNRLHEVEERLARWLLMVHDRVGEDKLALTQEFLAMMLGTRRSSVTLAAGSLQRAGLIEYHRGLVHILDKDSLRLAACECYSVARKLFTSLYK